MMFDGPTDLIGNFPANTQAATDFILVSFNVTEGFGGLVWQISGILLQGHTGKICLEKAQLYMYL